MIHLLTSSSPECLVLRISFWLLLHNHRYFRLLKPVIRQTTVPLPVFSGMAAPSQIRPAKGHSRLQQQILYTSVPSTDQFYPSLENFFNTSRGTLAGAKRWEDHLQYFLTVSVLWLGIFPQIRSFSFLPVKLCNLESLGELHPGFENKFKHLLRINSRGKGHFLPFIMTSDFLLCT